MSLSDNPKARLAQLRERWEAEPGSRIFLQLAEEYRRQGFAEEAAKVLESGLQHHPSSIAGYVALGRCRLELGEAEAARDALEGVVSRDPTQMVAYRHLVDAYLALGEPDRARNRLELYVQLNPMDDDIVRLREQIEAAEAAPPAAEEPDAFPQPPDAVPTPEQPSAPTDPAVAIPGQASSSPFDSLAVEPPESTAVTQPEIEKPDWARLLDSSSPDADTGDAQDEQESTEVPPAVVADAVSTADEKSQISEVAVQPPAVIGESEDSGAGTAESGSPEAGSELPGSELPGSELPGSGARASEEPESESSVQEDTGLPEDFEELSQDEAVRTITAPLSKFDLDLRPPEAPAQTPTAPESEDREPAGRVEEDSEQDVVADEASVAEDSAVPTAAGGQAADGSEDRAGSKDREGSDSSERSDNDDRADDNVFVLVPLSLQPLPKLSELPIRELRPAARIPLTEGNAVTSLSTPSSPSIPSLSSDVPGPATGDARSEAASATSTLAGLYLEQGHADEAAELYRGVLEREPDNELARRGAEVAQKAEGRENRAARNVTAGELVDSEELQGLDRDQRRTAVLKGYLARLKNSHEE